MPRSSTSRGYALRQLLSSIFRARKAGLLRIRPAPDIVRLECIGGVCGLCCATMGGGITVSKHEATALPKDAVTQQGENLFLKSHCGSCVLLESRMCSAYSARPKGCREYPWYNIEGRLHYDSGCPGIHFDRDERPCVVSLTPIEAYFPISRFLQRLLIGLIRHW